jgi:hypothetical protein
LKNQTFFCFLNCFFALFNTLAAAAVAKLAHFKL